MGLRDLALLPFAVRRLAVEFRGLRRAAERIADVLELQHLGTVKGTKGFTSFSREKHPSDGKGSGVAYVNPKELTELLARESELKALLGRDPTEAELERAFAGEIE